MKAPLWKRLLSHFFEFHIESAPSEHNPHLYVSLSRGRYQLCTQNAIYSYGDLYDNFLQAFQQINLDAIPIQKVLVLGFGLGSIPIILEQQFKKKYHYAAIEIDESVIYLASKYALPEIKSSVELLTADAEAFVAQCTQSFDLITMDIFLDDIIPGKFETSDFLYRLKSLLTPQGLLMYNRLTFNEKDIQSTRKFYEQVFQNVFPQATYLDVHGNWMLLNRKDYCH